MSKILLLHGNGQTGEHIKKKANLPDAYAPTKIFWSKYHLRYADAWITEPTIIAGFSAGANLAARLNPSIPPIGLIIFAGVFDAKFWDTPVRHTCPVAVAYNPGGLWYEEEEAYKFMNFYPNACLFVGSMNHHAWDPSLNEAMLCFLQSCS